MEKSQSVKEIGASLIKFHQKVEGIKKDAINPFFKSKYASLTNVLDGINKPLEEAGLSFVQFPSSTAPGTTSLTTLLIHKDSGEYIQDTFTMKPAKDDPQAQGSCITYMRRYALCAILGLGVEDDDGQDASTNAPQVNKPVNPLSVSPK